MRVVAKISIIGSLSSFYGVKTSKFKLLGFTFLLLLLIFKATVDISKFTQKYSLNDEINRLRTNICKYFHGLTMDGLREGTGDYN